MVKKVKAGFTVEAALICPFLCLILCGMLQFTLRLYQRVDLFAARLEQEQERELPADYLIRLEAVIEGVF